MASMFPPIERPSGQSSATLEWRERLVRSAKQAEINERCLSIDHLGSRLGRRSAQGVAVAMSSQGILLIMQLVSSAILARLLSPADFGLVAMAGTVTAFIGLFTDLGLASPTIQRQSISQKTISTLFFIGLAVGIALMVLSLALAPLAAMLFRDWRVAPLVIGLAATIPLSAAASQHNALLMRGMRWLPANIITIAGQAAGAIVGVYIAYRTGSYWALVAQALVTTAVRLLAVWMVCPWRPSFNLDWRNARGEIGFGLNLTGFGVVNYFHRQLDNVLIGRRWGEVELGYYSRAYGLMLMPLTIVNGPATSTMVPLLSRSQLNPDLWRGYLLRAMAGICFAGYAIACELIVNAGAVIEVVLGPKWDETAIIFGLLAISLFGATPMNASGWIYISLDRTPQMLRWSFLSSTILVSSFLIGLPYRASGVALVYALAVCFTTFPCLWFASRGTPVKTRQILRAIAAPFAASLATLLVAVPIAHILLAELAPLPRLLIGTAATGLIYVAFALLAVWFDPCQSAQRVMLQSAIRSVYDRRLGLRRQREES